MILQRRCHERRGTVLLPPILAIETIHEDVRVQKESGEQAPLKLVAIFTDDQFGIGDWSRSARDLGSRLSKDIFNNNHAHRPDIESCDKRDTARFWAEQNHQTVSSIR